MKGWEGNQMISVKVANKEDYERYLSEAARWGKNFKEDDNTYILYANVNEMLYGIGIVKLYEEYAILEDVIFNPENQFDMLGYLLGTSILNFVERRGVLDVYCCSENMDNLLNMLKFKKVQKKDILSIPEIQNYNNIYHVNLKNYFECSCSK